VQALLDAILFDIGGTLVEEAPPGTATSELTGKLRPGVIDDIRKLATHCRIGAVSNTAVMTEADMRALLAPLGLDELLEVVVTSTDVGAAKPSPLALVTAMERLGLKSPSRILYVGDQPTDAEAAIAAGMQFADITTADRISDPVAATVSGWFDRQAGHRIEKARADVESIDSTAKAEGTRLQDSLTKPPGSLGRLEKIGVQLSGIGRTSPPPIPEPAAVVVFAGDHGVVGSGVSAWPQEVTAQMVANFCNGGAAVNVLARQVGATVTVVDVGVATPIPVTGPGLLHRSVRLGTDDLSRGVAMTRTDALLALDVGVELADRCVDAGARCLITGDMGIGNTTASAAIIAAVTGRTPVEVTGRGAGADDATMHRKVGAITDALERFANNQGPNGSLSLLEEFGGLEIAALAGFIIGGAAHRVPIITDGVIATAALLVAYGLAPDIRGYVIAGHRSVEPGATIALDHLELEPLLDLDLRLGEGSGAVLALPLVQAAARIMGEMATFDSAGVTDKHN
jgi:nicotinate-nucleotide--dimethylbenzimidazole phosphoribosyltransferase